MSFPSHLSVPVPAALAADPDGVLVQSASQVPGFRIPAPTVDQAVAMLRDAGCYVASGGNWYGPVYFVRKGGAFLGAYVPADLVRLLPRLLAF